MFEQYAHNMIKEIHDQPEVFRRIIDRYMPQGQAEFEEFSEFKKKLRQIKRFSFWGLGSSFNAAMYGNYLFEELLGMPCECELGDEVISRQAVVEPDTAVVVISQSGKTSDLVKAVKMAKMKNALTIGLTNNPESEVAYLSDVHINLQAGEEKATAATKTFTAQLFLLYLLANYWRQEAGRKINTQAIERVGELPEKTALLLYQAHNIERMARDIAGNKDIIILGRKYNYPIALEAAQKIKETAYVHAEGFATEEFQHGPKAIVEPGWPVFFLLPHDILFHQNLDVLKDIKKIGALVRPVTTVKNEGNEGVIVVPDTTEELTPIFFTIVMQMLAYYLAVSKGVNIDNPRYIEKFIKK